MIVFKFTYNRISEQVNLKKTQIYDEMDETFKLDSIQDAISELKKEYQKVYEESETRYNNKRRAKVYD
tara:strand:- start:342 stop:545 length:204 start_codon:yes stop_codon:yes gene_type:complete